MQRLAWNQALGARAWTRSGLSVAAVHKARRLDVSRLGLRPPTDGMSRMTGPRPRAEPRLEPRTDRLPLRRRRSEATNSNQLNPFNMHTRGMG
eukprot:1576501-Pleurochrysis_carterae.AAC.2